MYLQEYEDVVEELGDIEDFFIDADAAMAWDWAIELDEPLHDEQHLTSL